MPSLKQIRAACVARLNTVPGIGRVHGFERYAADTKAMRDLYLSDNRILGWHLRRTATVERRIAHGRGQVDHTWLIRGFMSLSDEHESELEFDDLIEAIRTAWRADETLGDLLLPFYGVDSDEQFSVPQLTNSAPVMLAGVLCHSAELRLVTRSYA